MKLPRLIGDYPNRYPTRGDLARAQVLRRGLLYSSDAQSTIKERLSQISLEKRKLFALACAERTLRLHEHLPSQQQRSFTLGWRSTLNDMWGYFEGRSPTSPHKIQATLEPFYSSLPNHSNGPQDAADDDAAAACICAAECFINGEVDSAALVSSLLIEVIYRTVADKLQLDPNDFDWSPDAEPMALAQEYMHPLMQEELHRQLADLEEIQNDEISPNLLERLKL